MDDEDVNTVVVVAATSLSPVTTVAVSDGTQTDNFGSECVVNNDDYMKMQSAALNNQQQDDAMSAGEKFEHFILTADTDDKQMAIRNILKKFQDVRDNEQDFLLVLNTYVKLSTDQEYTTRVEVADMLPHVCAYFLNQVFSIQSVKYSPLELNSIASLVLENLLLDENSQVRKVTQNSLTLLLERGFIPNDFIEQKLSKVILRLMEYEDEEEYRVEAVVTMNKILRYLNEETIERLFVNKFCLLCSDNSCGVRRVCASSFGELCNILDEEITEKILLPQFKLLCEDEVWGVRKSCADVFVPVSCICSNETRRNVLAPLFINLLYDNSKWVVNTAYQALGPFISTFADPTKTGLFYNDGSVIVVDDGKDHESNDSGCSVHSSESNISPELEETEENVAENHLNSMKDLFTVIENNTNDDEEEEKKKKKDSIDAYDTFYYWRDPLPEVEIDVNSELSVLVDMKISENVNNLSSPLTIATSADLASSASAAASILLSVDDERSNRIDDLIFTDSERNFFGEYRSMDTLYLFRNRIIRPEHSELLLHKETHYTYSSFDNQPPLSSHVLTRTHALTRPKSQKTYQDIIPDDLLSCYLNMTNSYLHRTHDSDLTQYCAYSLPAVALTLGRRYWPCLRETYMQLASDMQWKVRWTLASSLHKMALIIGPHHTTQDLVPVFLNFIKDLDEVRYGILQNLASILEVLKRDEQLSILPKLSEFLKMDYPRNWRFRCTLAHQLVAVAHIYSALEVIEFLVPIGINLIIDKIAEVRRSAIYLLSNLLKRIYCDITDANTSNEKQSRDAIITELITCLVATPKWYLRQAFILLAEKVLVDGSLPVELFVELFLNPLEMLSTDPVPNVRLVLSRFLGEHVHKNKTLWENNQLRKMIKNLRNDTDRDVRDYLSKVALDDDNVVVGVDDDDNNKDLDTNVVVDVDNNVEKMTTTTTKNQDNIETSDIERKTPQRHVRLLWDTNENENTVADDESNEKNKMDENQ